MLRFATKDVPDEFLRAKHLLEQPGLTCVVADAVWIEIAYALEHHYGLDRAHSHSIVAGGLLVTSKTTRLISGTSLVIRVLMRSRTS